ncbi:MAG TPA: hypothetical protein PKC44_11855, partial [Agitococcus sp.]|nr:hypothetical protein [Agitococcus sp.]
MILIPKVYPHPNPFPQVDGALLLITDLFSIQYFDNYQIECYLKPTAKILVRSSYFLELLMSQDILNQSFTLPNGSVVK